MVMEAGFRKLVLCHLREENVVHHRLGEND